ncbi:hypothetical protein KFL_008340050 [Klebsormidium nitens]|uniref:GDSL esterase/lipase n=1 Tax=Klebsormidium nitens TaxID=105231 RepID=A0A1Y1ILC6_KLENI|nr:hypothetical protein KFL_008340050 [Klebsormidium nitens]|eukprot:GAQ91685.1 hypothetical protein KFL_008340050 [Klebsormidium nitens]
MAHPIRLGLLPCLLFPLLLATPAVGAIQPKVPAVFAFGDELLDTGNCLALPGVPRLADSKPYGLATFGRPTGRYSDGKLVVDHLADLLGIPYLIPYAVTALINVTDAHRTSRAANEVLPAVPLTESAAQLAHGISYAACGAGALQSTAGWSSLEEQVAAFEWAVKNGTWAPMTVTNALVVMSVGSHDYVHAASKKGAVSQFLETQVVSVMSEAVSSLYSLGLRRFLLLGVPAIGCTPKYRGRIDTQGGRCDEKLDSAALGHNVMLKTAAHGLRERMKGAVVVVVDTFEFVFSAIAAAEKAGWDDVKVPCCSGECSKDKAFTVCDRPAKYLWWDDLHLSDAANRQLAQRIFDGHGGYTTPGSLADALGFAKLGPVDEQGREKEIWESPEWAALAWVAFCFVYVACLVYAQLPRPAPPGRYSRP